MSAATKLIDDVAKLEPREAAEQLVASQQRRHGWLDAFAEHLDLRRAGQSLARTLTVWDLNQSQAARLFGVSRQALNKWLGQGVPGERAEAVANLAAATDLLVHHLKRDRIPAVVRRAMPSLGDQSLLDLWATGETSSMLQACRDMFSFERVHS
jgi:DNA-binding transcriptional regulator YdaS (Cro superfamily)